MPNSTNFVVHLDPPPLHIIFLMQIFGLSANILNHRATRVLFEGDSIAIALANSIISMIMVIVICGSIELFTTMTNSKVSTFQGPIFILTAVIMHPILLINNFAEIGYTCGTAPYTTVLRNNTQGLSCFCCFNWNKNTTDYHKHTRSQYRNTYICSLDTIGHTWHIP